MSKTTKYEGSVEMVELVEKMYPGWTLARKAVSDLGIPEHILRDARAGVRQRSVKHAGQIIYSLVLQSDFPKAQEFYAKQKGKHVQEEKAKTDGHLNLWGAIGGINRRVKALEEAIIGQKKLV